MCLPINTTTWGCHYWKTITHLNLDDLKTCLVTQLSHQKQIAPSALLQTKYDQRNDGKEFQECQIACQTCRGLFRWLQLGTAFLRKGLQPPEYYCRSNPSEFAFQPTTREGELEVGLYMSGSLPKVVPLFGK